MFGLDASGNLGGQNDACAFTGTFAARKSVNVLDWTVKTLGQASCIFGRGPIWGVIYYDATNRRIHGFAPFVGHDDQWYLIGTKQ